MVSLPAVLQYGQVKGRLVSTSADTSTDGDGRPNAVAPVGTVRFRPSVKVQYVADGADPAIVLVRPVSASVDAAGVLRDSDGNPTVYLIATDSAGLSRNDWQWIAEFNLAGGDKVDPIPFELPADAVVDLASVAPVDTISGGIAVTRGPAGLSAYELAVEAGFVGTEADWSASLVGPKGDPGVPGVADDASVAALVDDDASLTAERLRAAFGRSTDAYGAAAAEPDGTPTHMTSGQPARVFGSTPITVTGGAYVHTPSGLNSAGYLQAQLLGPADRIGCRFTAAANATGSLALVLPAAEWNAGGTGPIGPAGVHFVLTAGGAWNVAYWDGSGQTNYAFGQLSASIKDGLPHKVDLTINRDTSTLYLSLPGGAVVAITDPRIASTTADWAVWELYEADGTGAVPVKLNTVWADSAAARGEAPSAATPLDVARAVTSTQGTVKAITYAPASSGDVVAPTSLTDIDEAHLTLPPIVAPASGRVLVEMTGYVAMSGPALYLWAVANGATSFGTQIMVNQQYNGYLTYRRVLDLDPGQTYDFKWQHFCTAADTATFKLNDGGGYHATMSATPLG